MMLVAKTIMLHRKERVESDHAFYLLKLERLNTVLHLVMEVECMSDANTKERSTVSALPLLVSL